MPETVALTYSLPGTVKGKSALGLFLYALEEDPELRSTERQYERVEDGWISRPPSLRLKCTYVVSAWASDDNQEEAALTQLSLLGAAYSAVVSDDAFSGDCLPAPLNDPKLPKPVINLSDNDLPNRPEFWTSAGCVYRPSFSLTAAFSTPSTGDIQEYIVEGLHVDYRIR